MRLASLIFQIVLLRHPQVWPTPQSRGGAKGTPERRLRWESVKGPESCVAEAWRRGTSAASRAGPGWQQQAGVHLHTLLSDTSLRLQVPRNEGQEKIYMMPVCASWPVEGSSGSDMRQIRTKLKKQRLSCAS